MKSLSFETTHPSWHPYLQKALTTMDPSYLKALMEKPNPSWLPGPQEIFNAFKQPLSSTRFILLGESPYPRPQSANGYAFWDGAVTELWSPSGLSKTVNRATSLRNFIKMLLISEGLLTASHTSQEDIAKLDKKNLVQQGDELFRQILDRGFLLLNASLVLSDLPPQQEAKAWFPFLNSLMESLGALSSPPMLLLFGRIANTLQKLPCIPSFKQLSCEHPYNVSFITNPEVIHFFKPLHILMRDKQATSY